MLIFPSKRLITANITVGLGSRGRNGNIFVTEKI